MILGQTDFFSRLRWWSRGGKVKKEERKIFFSWLIILFSFAMIGCDDGGTETSAQSYTVTFNRNGGAGSAPAAQTVTAGSGITLPSGDGLSKYGYVFSGWNTNAEGTGTSYDADSSYTPTGNITLYVKWMEGYTVTFNRNAGSGTPPAAMTASSGSSITLPPGDSISRNGYTFRGWNTNANGTGTNYEAGASYTVTENITLYAKWESVYIIIFHANGGSGAAPQQMIVPRGAAATLPDKGELSRAYANFGGWNANAEGTGTNYNANASFTPNSNITLYAKWNSDGAAYENVTGAANKMAWLQINAQSGADYSIEIDNAETMEFQNLSYFGKTVSITIKGRGGEKVVSLARSDGHPLFTVDSGVTLTLDENITLQGPDSSNNAALVKVNSGGALVMKAGSKITGNGRPASAGEAPVSAGGVSVENNGNFTLDGGEISGNTSTSGGGVSLSSYATFTMNSGKISGNNASIGGGVAVSTYATFTMNDGEISGNNITGYGGGVSVSTNATFIMNGGKISGNNAGNTVAHMGGFGGGVYVYNSATFIMNNGEISGNYTGGYGGGVNNSGTFRIVTGTIYGSNEPTAILRNTSGDNGDDGTIMTANSSAALYSKEHAPVERGTFSGGTWNKSGDLSLTAASIGGYRSANTIKVANGAVVP